MAPQTDSPLLGLATTRELLMEIQARGEYEMRYREEGDAMALGAAHLLDTLPGSMLDYRTVDEPQSDCVRCQRPPAECHCNQYIHPQSVVGEMILARRTRAAGIPWLREVDDDRWEVSDRD